MQMAGSKIDLINFKEQIIQNRLWEVRIIEYVFYHFIYLQFFLQDRKLTGNQLYHQHDHQPWK